MSLHRRRAGTGYSYWEDKKNLPGVTTIMRETLPMHGLDKWAAGIVADLVCGDEWPRIRRIQPIEARRDYLATAHNRERSQAAVKGTAIHRLAEDLNMGKRVDVPPELEPHVDRYRDFAKRMDLDTIAVELPVFNRTVGYGGTIDVIADLGPVRWGGDELPPATWLLDIKSGKSIWPDAAIQCCAYRHAEVYLDADGQEASLSALGIAHCGAVHLRADGWDLRPLDSGRAVWDYFQTLAWQYRLREIKADWVGPAADPPLPFS